MKYFVALLPLLAALANGAPTTKSASDVEATTETGVHPKMFEGQGEAVADVALTVAKSIGFAGGVAVNGAALGANVAMKAAAETSETAVKAGEQAVRYVSAFDAIEALDKTEETLKKNKHALIGKIFDAKRQAVETVRGLAEKGGEVLGVVAEKKREGFEAAVGAASAGYKVSKDAVTAVTREINKENAEAVISTAHEAVADGIHVAQEKVQGAVNTLVDTLAAAKVSLVTLLSKASNSLNGLPFSIEDL